MMLRRVSPTAATLAAPLAATLAAPLAATLAATLAAPLLALALAAPLFAADAPAQQASGDPAPKGDLLHHTFAQSKVFPGTMRDYWIYVPKQYDGAKPACLYVNQDGVQFRAPEVFDLLIAKGEMPVTIGVFVTPGRVPALAPDALDRFNRSLEYDGLGDAYVRFLLDELLPDVETKKAPDGRKIHLSKSGADRCIGGSSSGAICAFTAAWERPDAFGRVFSAIGTYVGLRGGNEYPTLIRKTEPKPLKIFLQDGSADQNIYGGDWWMANQEMERALTFAGYEVNHAWGDGGHNGKHATEVFPNAMRWLWKDWPAPIKTGAGSPQLQEIVAAGEGWKPVGGEYRSPRALAVDAQGQVHFSDPQQEKTWILDPSGRASADPRKLPFAYCQAFAPDGSLVASPDKKFCELTATAPDGTQTSIAERLLVHKLVVLHNGGVYTASYELQAPDGMAGLCYCPAAGKPRKEDRLYPISPGGIVCSPDQSLLYVSDKASHWVYSYQIQPDGSLAHKQRYYHLHAPDTADSACAGALRVDRDGRLYVATTIGVQVCDQAGRVNCILPTPAIVSDIEFGGANFGTLFAVWGERIYWRKMKIRGAPAFDPPHKPAAPRL